MPVSSLTSHVTASDRKKSSPFLAKGSSEVVENIKNFGRRGVGRTDLTPFPLFLDGPSVEEEEQKERERGKVPFI